MRSPRRCYYSPTLEAVLHFPLVRWVSVGDEGVRTPISYIGGLTRDLNRLGEPTLAFGNSGLYVELSSALRVSAPIPPRFECQKSLLSVCSGTVLEMLKSVTVSIDRQKGSLA